ncbi:MAG: zinc ribbon domain-containing protein [Bacilli bacterium]|nr:zinc ribbon domain-containing protein [Bacilli bacterium]
MICPNCQTYNVESAQYCTGCGKKLEKTEGIQTSWSKAVFMLSVASLLFPLISINDIVIFIGFGFGLIVLINTIILKTHKKNYHRLNISMAFAISVVIIEMVWYLFFHFILPYL